MRKIAFRAWADGKMWYPDKKREDWWFFGSEGYWALNHGSYIERVLCDSLESKNAVLMQYTGLKDESGTETYEGDLVRIKDRTDVYKFVFDGFYSAFLFVGVHGGERITTNRLAGDWVRVIGNIHENPDLLPREVQP